MKRLLLFFLVAFLTSCEMLDDYIAQLELKNYDYTYIDMKDYPDLKALRTYGERKYSQKFIPELINELYKETMFENLMILK